MRIETLGCIFCVVAIVVLIALEIISQKKNGTLTLESAEEIALSIISKVALKILTDAECIYGSGTGDLKMSYCMEKLIELLPASVVEVVPKKTLQDALEIALEKAKVRWATNPDLLNTERIGK